MSGNVLGGVLDVLSAPAQPIACAADATALAAAFDTLFGTPTGYDRLDHRAALTRARKDHLLMVLKHPDPSAQQPSGVGGPPTRPQAGCQPRRVSPEGLAAWNAFQTIVETAKKLGVNLTAYLRDRITNRYALPNLTYLIARQSLSCCPPPRRLSLLFIVAVPQDSEGTRHGGEYTIPIQERDTTEDSDPSTNGA